MWMAKCNQLTPLPFKGLKQYVSIGYMTFNTEGCSMYFHKFSWVGLNC